MDYRRGALYNIRRFLEDTDFHGIRFVARNGFTRKRRSLWLIIFFICLVSFIFLASMRILKYLEYPYITSVTVTTESVPLPAVAVCTMYHAKHHSLPANIFTTSDTDFIYLSILSHHMDITQTVQDITTGDEYLSIKNTFKPYILEILNDTSWTSVDSTGNVTVQPIDDRIQAHNDSKKFFRTFSYIPKDETIILNVLRRFLYVPDDIRLGYQDEFRSVVEKYGISRFTNDTISKCSISNLDAEEIIRCNLTTVFTDSGTCVTFQYEGPTFAVSTLTSNGLQISIGVPLDEIILYAFIYDRKEIPNYYYDSVTTFAFRSPSRTRTELYGVYSRYTLPQPYHIKGCQEKFRSVCIEECLIATMNCTKFYLSDDAISTESKINGTGKNLCPILEQLTVSSSEIIYCKTLCPPSCTQTGYSVKTTGSYKWSKPTNIFEFRMRVATGLLYERYVEEGVYPFGQLLAELGGIMGLFIGASVLTLVHCLEFSVTSLYYMILKVIYGSKNAGNRPLKVKAMYR